MNSRFVAESDFFAMFRGKQQIVRLTVIKWCSCLVCNITQPTSSEPDDDHVTQVITSKTFTLEFIHEGSKEKMQLRDRLQDKTDYITGNTYSYGTNIMGYLEILGVHIIRYQEFIS